MQSIIRKLLAYKPTTSITDHLRLYNAHTHTFQGTIVNTPIYFYNITWSRLDWVDCPVTGNQMKSSNDMKKESLHWMSYVTLSAHLSVLKSICVSRPHFTMTPKSESRQQFHHCFLHSIHIHIVNWQTLTKLAATTMAHDKIWALSGCTNSVDWMDDSVPKFRLH